MKHRLNRRERKKRKRIMIFSIIGIFCFFSVGYATFGSNFMISGKGTIVGKPITVDELKNKVVTSGDGLYKDSYEEGRYLYKGANPNNYLTIDGKVYRIMSIESDNNVKVIQDEQIESVVFDYGYLSPLPAGFITANTLEETRWSNVSTDYCYYSTSTTAYYGCKIWGSKTTILDSSGNNITSMPFVVGDSTKYNLPDKEAYLNTYLNTTYYDSLLSIKNKIVEHEFYIGAINDTTSQSLETDINQEKEYRWKGKIGLMSATDYVRASTNEACTNVYNYKNNTSCYNNSQLHNYLFSAERVYFTLTPRSYRNSSGGDLFVTSGNGSIRYSLATSKECVTRPVFYLTSEITLTGTGTESDMYKVN